MDSDNKTSKIHPLTAAAATALILVCLTGIAAMFGLVPNLGNKNTAPVATTDTVVTPNVPTPAPVAASSVAPTPTSVVAASPQPTPPPKVVQKKPAVKKPVTTEDQYKESRTVSSCSNCGVVESVRPIEQEAPTSGIGAGVGAVVGGLLGNQVGAGNGRTLATIAGAVGGGYAGNVIEKKRNTSVAYEVTVRMDDGVRQRFHMNEQRWRSGDLVRVSNGALISR